MWRLLLGTMGVRAKSHYVKFGLTQSRKIFCVSRRANTPVSRSCVKRSFSGQGVSHERSWPWVISPQYCLQNEAKATTCLADSTIDRRASSAWSFCRPQPFRSQCFFFSIPQCNCWSGPMKLRNKFWNCGPTVKGGQPTTWCRRQRFMFAKLPRWLSAGQEKVDAKSQQWNPWSKVDKLRRKGKDLIPNRNFSTMRMIRHRTFPSKDESTNGGRSHQTTKNAKKADATASTQAPPLRWRKCVWRRVFAIFFTLSWKFRKTQPRQSKLDVVWLGPKEPCPRTQRSGHGRIRTEDRLIRSPTP